MYSGIIFVFYACLFFLRFVLFVADAIDDHIVETYSSIVLVTVCMLRLISHSVCSLGQGEEFEHEYSFGCFDRVSEFRVENETQYF